MGLLDRLQCVLGGMAASRATTKAALACMTLRSAKSLTGESNAAKNLMGESNAAKNLMGESS